MRTIPFVLAFFLILGSPLAAQEAFSKARDPLTANEIVTLGIELPDRTVEIAAVLGQLARFKEGDLSLGMTPIREEGELLLKLFNVRVIDLGDGELHEALDWIETINFREDQIFPKSGVTIKLLGISLIPESELGILHAKAKASQCCLTCGGTTSYGCAVSDSCGTCCVDPCCNN